MNGNVPTSNEAPSIEVVRDFWTKIVSTVGKVKRRPRGEKMAKGDQKEGG